MHTDPISTPGGLNNALAVGAPLNAALPYEVVTEGGSSGRVTDVTGITASAATGTPLTGGEASANVGQTVTVAGNGFAAATTKIVLEAMDQSGTPYITTFDPASVAANGQSLTFAVPPQARSGSASVLNAGGAKMLQIVPRVTGIDGGRGRGTFIWGSGFIEGFITVRFGWVRDGKVTE